jgi:hypothetical protein
MHSIFFQLSKTKENIRKGGTFFDVYSIHAGINLQRSHPNPVIVVRIIDAVSLQAGPVSLWRQVLKFTFRSLSLTITTGATLLRIQESTLE